MLSSKSIFPKNSILKIKKLLLSFLLFGCYSAGAQSFTSYFTGDTSNVNNLTTPGLCLMGGATENDSASTWWLQRAGGGDIVVLRASGSNGYNSYFFTDLGQTVNSVETIVFNDATAAQDPYVRRRIAEAEALWIAGGDQSDYVDYWRGTGIDSLINQLANVKRIPIGGTSADMAILGFNYYSALNGSVTSAAALANPFNNDITLGQNDFLKMPFMQGVITDTHYDNPDRRGRHVVFLSRLIKDSSENFLCGIACDEYTAVCVDGNGKARVYGEFPAQDDNAYFLQVNCAVPNNPEMVTSGQPLNWVKNNEAVKVYHAKGTENGAQFLNLTDWKTGSGGAWENWWVNNGTLQTASGMAPDCVTSVQSISSSLPLLAVYPNPANESLFIETTLEGTAFLIALDGRIAQEIKLKKGQNKIAVQEIAAGVYELKLKETHAKILIQR